MYTNTIVNKKTCWGIDKKARDFGVKFKVAKIINLSIQKKNKALKNHLKERIDRIQCINVETDSILKEYRQMFDRLGLKNLVSSPEYLIQMVKKSGKLPQINTLVDAYNQISAEKKIVISCHDSKKVSGDIWLKTADEQITFKPLGSTKDDMIHPLEWYVHDDTHALCRLNCKQSSLSSVDLNTNDIIVYIQGNSQISEEIMDASMKEVCKFIIHYNGGEISELKEIEQ